MSNARLQLPAQVNHGELVRARLLVAHPMETGYLQDLSGKTVPRNVIRDLVCEYGGRQIFRVEPSSGISGNPFFEFFFRAGETGDLLISWVDDQGVRGQLRQLLRVQGPSSVRPPG
jgi:sulfur-oxidizing protein SoxZ